jgi:hypothetical protein
LIPSTSVGPTRIGSPFSSRPLKRAWGCQGSVRCRRIEQVALFGVPEGASMCLLFGDVSGRTSAIILFGGFARRRWGPTTRGAAGRASCRVLEEIEHDWAVGRSDLRARNKRGDARFRDNWRYIRMGAGREPPLRGRMNAEIDVRPVPPPSASRRWCSIGRATERSRSEPALSQSTSPGDSSNSPARTTCY